MAKKLIRNIFIGVVIVWMFLLGFLFIYSKKLSVKTSYAEIEFKIVEQSTANLPTNFKVIKPGIKGKKFLMQEYIPFLNKSINFNLSVIVIPEVDEVIYTGNGNDEELKFELLRTFNEKVELGKTVSQNPDLFLEFKEIGVEFFNEAKQPSEDSVNQLIIGKVKFLMDNCHYYNSLDVLINTEDLSLNLSEIAENSLCNKYERPSEIVQIECSNCDLAPVDKFNSLHSGYTPNVVTVDFIPGGFQIKDSVYESLKQMYIAAKNDGINFKLTSTYRSHDSQKGTFDGWVAYEQSFGKSYEQSVSDASSYSARPGHSEHQLGTTADINSGECAPFVSNCLDNDRVWEWLKNNAHKFGFVMSYQKGKEDLTGYVYEPWHYRWIGVELATEYKSKYEGISYTTEFLRNIAK